MVSAAVLLGFAAAEWLHHARGLAPETSRKVAHVWSGAVTASFPWLVESHLSVLGLALGFGAFLGGTRLLGWLPSVHAVKRRTQGAYYYPFAIWLTFYLSAGDPAPYVIAISVLALSDTAAATVGTRQPIKRYHVFDKDFRSLGGSLALLGVTFAIVLVALAAFGRESLPSVLTIALLVGLAAAATEGVSVRGLDNLLLPYVVVVVLNATLGASPEALSDWVLGALLTSAALLPALSLARLGETGILALFLAGFLAFGLGGGAWLLPLLLPYTGFVATRAMDKPGDAAGLGLLAPALGVSLALLLAFAHSGWRPLYLPYMASIAAVSALAWSQWTAGRSPSLLLAVAAGVIGASVAVGPSLLIEPPVPLDLPQAGAVVTFAAVAPLLARAAGRTTGLARLTGVLGSTAVCAVWMMVQAP